MKAQTTTTTITNTETTMAKTKVNTRIVAVILSVITAFSITAVAFTSASAASVADKVTMLKYKGDTIYYSDEYFKRPSSQYDPHLATLSCIMTNYTVPLNSPKSVTDSNWYLSQPERLNGFFNTIGFKDFKANEDYTKRSAFDTIGVAAAQKKVGDYTVIGVGLRSGGYFREWGNNVYLGDGTKSDYMHEGWYNAANKTIKFLNDYISANNINGKIKLWIAGFSRGGATSNLTAGLLDNKIDKKEKIFTSGATLTHDDLYAYTFEAPQGANYNSKNVKLPGDQIYNNIWNIVNPNDLVPKVAMSEFGFTRFGTDKYITTKFFDAKGFADNRNTMKVMYEKNGHPWSGYSADEFKMYNLPIKNAASLITKLSSSATSDAKNGKNPIFEADTKKINYDSNIATTLVLEETTRNIGNRANYCKYLQDGVSKFLLAFMSDVDAIKNEDLGKIAKNLFLSKLCSQLPGCKEKADKLVKEALPGNKDAYAIRDALDPLLSILVKVYIERPNELVSTMLNISSVFQNHDFDVTIAHMEAQDNYYIDAHNSANANKINIVPLRDCADLGRVSFKDYNSLTLLDSTGKTEHIKVTGAKLEKSVIHKCDPGFAVGYYSYLTEDKMEIFMPVGQTYEMKTKAYSIKPKHTVWYKAFYQSAGPNKDHRYKDDRGHFEDWFYMNSDLMEQKLNMNYQFSHK